MGVITDIKRCKLMEIGGEMKMRRNRLSRVRIDDRQYELFFIRPKERTDARKYAEKLARMDNVAEVLVTEGECGFIVKARSGSHDAESVVEQILARTSYKKIASYYQYRK